MTTGTDLFISAKNSGRNRITGFSSYFFVGMMKQHCVTITNAMP
jgi:hypothetical protein